MISSSRQIPTPAVVSVITSRREHAIPFGDVAVAFGVQRSTVRHWFASGLEFIRERGRLCTSNEALQRFAADEAPTFRGERGDVSHWLDSLSDRR